MPQTLSVTEVTLKHFNLSITVRDNGESAEVLEELAYRTIGAWLWIAARLEQGVYTIPAELAGTVEARYADELTRIQLADTDAPPKEPFEFSQTFGDSRVTVWDSYRGAKRINFHLNSDDDLQAAVNTWLATQNATKRAFEKWGDVESKLDHAKASQPAQDVPPAIAPTTETMATPKSQNASKNAYSPESTNEKVAAQGQLFTKKEAIDKLQPGNNFCMKIVQIEKHSKDGSDFYEFYEPYGGKAGQFSATSVFVDNEIAVNNGLIAYLDTFGIKLGQALTGNWILNCSIGKPKTKVVKGEKKTFTNIYVNSFKGQETGDRHPNMADDIPQG